MADRIEFVTESFTILDTGIGIEAGYASDKEMLDAGAAERAALPPAIREVLDEADRRLDEALFFGSPRNPPAVAAADGLCWFAPR